MKKELTCIVCPIGCSLTATIENGKVINVSGNTCPRGKVYAENECTNPTRTITTTVRCVNGEMLCVKTENPISKENIFDAMKIINKTTPSLPICAGDVIIDNIFGTRLIATKNMN